MTHRLHFLAGVAIGIFILAVCIEAVRAVYARGLVCAFDGVLWWIGTFQWLEDYQTLITGIAAVIAARLSIQTIERQIKQADEAAKSQLAQVERIESERKEAKRTAVRAMLPLSLSSLSDYAQTCGLTLYKLHVAAPEPNVPVFEYQPQGDTEFPPLPDDAIATIKELIEFSNPELVRLLSELAAKVQVQSSRLRGLKRALAANSTVSKHSIEAYTLDAAEIYARCSSLFDYGRFKTERLPNKLTTADISSAIHNIGIYDNLHDDLIEHWGRISIY